MVLSEVPANATAVGVPAHIVKIAGEEPEKYTESVDQINTGDPVEEDIELLTTRIAELEEELANCRRRHPDHVVKFNHSCVECAEKKQKSEVKNNVSL